MVNSSSRALDTFGLYFDEHILDVIVAETNRYARQNGHKNWYDLTREELQAYSGIVILMSINPSYHVYLYWSSDNFFNVTEISKMIIFKQFQSTMNYLHFFDNERIKPREHPAHDKLAHRYFESQIHEPVQSLEPPSCGRRYGQVQRLDHFETVHAPQTNQKRTQDLVPGQLCVTSFDPFYKVK